MPQGRLSVRRCGADGFEGTAELDVSSVVILGEPSPRSFAKSGPPLAASVVANTNPAIMLEVRLIMTCLSQVRSGIVLAQRKMSQGTMPRLRSSTSERCEYSFIDSPTIDLTAP